MCFKWRLKKITPGRFTSIYEAIGIYRDMFSITDKIFYDTMAGVIETLRCLE